MTADNHNTIQSQGLYVWQADNLLAATATLGGRWQSMQNEEGNAVTLASNRITTDTRTIRAGDIFLALSGDNFDGHDYVNVAD